MTYRDADSPEIQVLKLQEEIKALKEQINKLKEKEKNFITNYDDTVTSLIFKEDKNETTLQTKVWGGKNGICWTLNPKYFRRLYAGAKIVWKLYLEEEKNEKPNT